MFSFTYLLKLQIHCYIFSHILTLFSKSQFDSTEAFFFGPCLFPVYFLTLIQIMQLIGWLDDWMIGWLRVSKLHRSQMNSAEIMNSMSEVNISGGCHWSTATVFHGLICLCRDNLAGAKTSIFIRRLSLLSAAFSHGSDLDSPVPFPFISPTRTRTHTQIHTRTLQMYRFIRSICPSRPTHIPEATPHPASFDFRHD